MGVDRKDDARGRDRAPALQHPGLGVKPPRRNVAGPPPGILKPIPINTRNIQRVMRSELDKGERVFRRWLVSTINAQRSAIKFEEIRNAMRSGNIDAAWLRAWREEYAEAINTRIAPAYMAVAERAGTTMTASAARRGLELPFAAAQQRTDAWIALRGAELVTDLTNSQALAVRNTLRVAAQAELNPRAAERFLRPIIGLDPRSAQAVANRRAGLAAQGLTERVVERQTSAYADRLLRVRTNRIARTEMATAWNQANNDLIAEGQSRGALGTVTVEWYTAMDERVCAYCGPLHGTVIPFGESFPTEDGAAFTPPAHPSCRCFVLYHTLPVS